MDKEELVDLLAMGPIRFSMNDGRSFDVVDDQYLVSDMSLMTLQRGEDRKLRVKILPFVTMTCAESLETA